GDDGARAPPFRGPSQAGRDPARRTRGAARGRAPEPAVRGRPRARSGASRDRVGRVVTRVTFRSMGCDVVVEGASPGGARLIRACFERYDVTFSRFCSDSELVRLNERGGGMVSELFARVLATALWARDETDGLVDPSVGGAVVAAGYDR